MKTWFIRVSLCGAFIVIGSISAFAISTTLVISQIYSSEDIGTTGGPRVRNDYVEIFNRSNTAINLTGWSLQIAAPASGSVWEIVPLAGSIAPGQYYLVRAKARPAQVALPPADATTDFGVEALGGRVALIDNTNRLGANCPDVVDFVAFGSSLCAQTAALDSRMALVRAAGGCRDTDGDDFALVTPYPRNSASPRNPCASTPVSRAFSVPANGGVSVQTTGAGTILGIGHVRIQPSSSSTPTGLEIFSYRPAQTLLSEASVPAAPLIRSGELFVEVSGPINTGIAIANPGDQDANIEFSIVDASRGYPVAYGTLTVPAKGQLARFVNELPYSLTTPLQGTFVFNSSAPVGVIALRGYTNERGEFLVTTLPVLDSAAPATGDPGYLAHFAAGGGWSTEVVLIDKTDQPATGNLEFRDSLGRPVNVRVGFQTGSSFPYSLTQRSAAKFTVTGAAGDLLSGSIRIAPTGGTVTPGAVAVFAYTRNNVRVSEAGVVSPQGSRFRTYVEYSGTPGATGAILPGIAIANSGTGAATVDLELTRLDGTATNLRTSITLPASGQTAKFVNELFPTLAAPFQGILRVSTTSSIALTGLRGRYNERNDFLITTVPAGDESAPASSAEFSFSHLADSAGYSTQFVLFGAGGQASTGNLVPLTSGGQPLAVDFR